MRLWSLHPKHLDRQGLLAAWREGLLAQAVLRGRTRGYRRHPQLDRFRAHARPLAAINAWLWHVLEESRARGYRFDRRKVRRPRRVARIPVRAGQVAHERRHLLGKLKRRDPERYRSTRRSRVELHPLMRRVRGGREPWERSS